MSLDLERIFILVRFLILSEGGFVSNYQIFSKFFNYNYIFKYPVIPLENKKINSR